MFDKIKSWFRREESDEGSAALTPTSPSAPVSDTAAPEYSGRERRIHPRPQVNEQARFLVVDDSKTIVAVLKKMLVQNGFAVETAADGREAVAKAREFRPHLIFLDIIMPGVNGFQALREIRRDAEMKDTAIIMISGNAQATEEFYVQRIGADDFMKKPFARQEVFARIEALIGENRLPQRAESLF